MGLMHILQQYAARPTSTEQDFDEVVGQVPREVLGEGVAQAFRSDATPPFGNLVSQMFGQLNPAAARRLAEPADPRGRPGRAGEDRGRRAGGIRRTRPTRARRRTTPMASSVHAEQVTPEQVREIAEEASKKDPSVMDRVGGLMRSIRRS